MESYISHVLQIMLNHENRGIIIITNEGAIMKQTKTCKKQLIMKNKNINDKCNKGTWYAISNGVQHSRAALHG